MPTRQTCEECSWSKGGRFYQKEAQRVIVYDDGERRAVCLTCYDFLEAHANMGTTIAINYYEEVNG